MDVSKKIRVLLVDDHAVVRLGLSALLATDPGMEIVGEANDGQAAIELAMKLEPDVVVMDVVMTGMDGAAATRELSRRMPNVRVIVLTMHDEEDYLIPLLEAGAAGYIVKNAASSELIDAIRSVAAGRQYVRPAAAKVLAAGWTRRAAQDQARSAFETLSERERDVFRQMAQGYSSAQIGARLFISAKTVDTYRRRINEKLGFTDRSDYVRLALDLGLLTSEGADPSTRAGIASANIPERDGDS
jgi:DNA-binding NarL/FixJ family response regulator